MSVRPSSVSPVACSGLMNSGVPTTSPTRVRPGAATLVVIGREIPKSMRSARPVARSIMMLSGLMSRWANATLITAVACPDGKEKQVGTATCARPIVCGRARPTLRLMICTIRCDTISATAACSAATSSFARPSARGTSAKHALAATLPRWVSAVQNRSDARDGEASSTQRRYSARSRASNRSSAARWFTRP